MSEQLETEKQIMRELLAGKVVREERAPDRGWAQWRLARGELQVSFYGEETKRWGEWKRWTLAFEAPAKVYSGKPRITGSPA